MGLKISDWSKYYPSSKNRFFCPFLLSNQKTNHVVNCFKMKLTLWNIESAVKNILSSTCNQASKKRTKITQASILQIYGKNQNIKKSNTIYQLN